MNLDELREELKDVLSYFGLAYGDGDQVEVTVSEGKLSFKYGDREVLISL